MKIKIYYILFFVFTLGCTTSSEHTSIREEVSVVMNFRPNNSLSLVLKSNNTIQYDYEYTGYTIRVYGDLIENDIIYEDVDLLTDEIQIDVIQNSTQTFYIDVYNPKVAFNPTDATLKAHYGLTGYRCLYGDKKNSITIPLELIQGAFTVTDQGEANKLTQKIFLYNQEIEYNQTLYIKESIYNEYNIVPAVVQSIHGNNIAMVAEVIAGKSILYIVQSYDTKIQFNLPSYNQEQPGYPIPPATSSIIGKGTYNVNIIDIIGGSAILTKHSTNNESNVFVLKEDIPKNKKLRDFEIDILAESLQGDKIIYVKIYLQHKGHINNSNDLLLYYIMGPNAGKYAIESSPLSFYNFNDLPKHIKDAKVEYYKQDIKTGNFFLTFASDETDPQTIVAIKKFSISTNK
ncbi:hypothetical protein K5X82_01380 [Halosquirtibacter xylanolyticus]|uniref:hypothetical protein n=1 Tax=Halosquirtibacter xylanolyticus TaxID=3374599 RepID=UPI00374A61CE|nr:hypothetical protein K5X82_01380 [Prolixibacteraceae bacterium]